MVLLYFVAGCVLLCLGSAEDVVYHDGHADEGHSRDEYPNPKSLIDYVRCRRKLVESYICDPDSVVSELEADQINEQLTATVNQSRCPCSRYSCLRHDDGYKIGIALMKKMKHGKAFDEWDAQEQSEKNWGERRREWLLHEAKLFADELLKKWRLGHCTEDVIVLYSLDDGVLYTAVGEVAGSKLNASVIRDVSRHASSQFDQSGSVFKGLYKMVKDYRSVFHGSYQMNRPVAKPLRGRSCGTSVMKCSGSFAAAVILLLFTFMLHRDVVGDTQ